MKINKTYLGVSITDGKVHATFEDYEAQIKQSICDSEEWISANKARLTILKNDYDRDANLLKERFLESKKKILMDISNSKARIRMLKIQPTQKDFEHDVQASEEEHQIFLKEHPDFLRKMR